MDARIARIHADEVPHGGAPNRRFGMQNRLADVFRRKPFDRFLRFIRPSGEGLELRCQQFAGATKPEPVADQADKDRPVAFRQLAACQETVERQAQEFGTATVLVQQAEEFIDPPVLRLVNERQLRCLAEPVQRTAAELKP